MATVYNKALFVSLKESLVGVPENLVKGLSEKRSFLHPFPIVSFVADGEEDTT